MTRATAAAKTAPAEIETLQFNLRNATGGKDAQSCSKRWPTQRDTNMTLAPLPSTDEFAQDLLTSGYLRSSDLLARPLLPRGQRPPDSKDTDPDGREVAEGFAEYYQSLFQRKSPKTSQAVDRARAALRGGRKVLAPESCGAEITAAEVSTAAASHRQIARPGPPQRNVQHRRK